MGLKIEQESDFIERGDIMIIQPIRKKNVDDYSYKIEAERIALLNREFFQDIELTKSENDILIWLCGWDDWTIKAIVSAFKKVKHG